MKKKLLLLCSIFMLIFFCIPATKAYAQGYAQEIGTEVPVNSLETHQITTGDESDLKIARTYIVYVPGTEKTLVLPITVNEKGILFFDGMLSDEYLNASGNIEFYADEACTQKIDFSYYDKYAFIPKGGVYYVKFTVTDSNNTPPEYYRFTFSSNTTSGADKSLKNNVWALTGNPDTTTAIYYKITTTKPGSLTINTDSNSSGYITLLNSSKKAISDKTYFYSNEDKLCFAVGKGTYYLKVETTSSLYYIKYSFKAISDTSGASKAKAKKLTAGKTLSGIVTPGEKTGKVDWYKVTLNKNQEIVIEFTGSVSSGSISLQFYGNGISGSIDKTINGVDKDASFAPVLWGSDKLPKGTYYIKVTKDTKNTSGFYSLKLTK